MNNTVETSQKGKLSQPSEQAPSPELSGPSLFAVRIFKFFASLKLAVMILLTLMIVLSAGTFIESSEGADAAKLLVYQAPWFSVILFLLVMNLTCAALDRLPWKIRHAGFVITHLGIILILFGSFVTQRLMVDGQISLAEGESEHRITLPDPLLYIYSAHHDLTWFLELPLHAFPWQGEKTITRTREGETTPFQVKLKTVYPKALMDEKITPAPAGGEPAIRVRLKNDFVDQEQWLIRRNPQYGEAQMGPAKLAFTDELLPDTQTEAPKSGYLEFQWPEKTVHVPLPDNMVFPAELPLEGTPYQVRIMAVYQNAAVEGKKLLEDPQAKKGEKRNPAVEFILKGEGVEEKHTAFSNFPDFPTVHGMKPSAAGMKVFYRMAQAGSRGERHEIRFAEKEGKVFCQIIEGMKAVTHEVKNGEKIPTGWMGGLSVTAEEFYPHSKIERSFRATHNLSENPQALSVIQLELIMGSESQNIWLRQGIREEIQIAGQPFTVVYGQKRVPAGFRLELKDFRLEQYPGSDRPASFESDVILKDDSRGVSKEVTISMNKPLAYRGYHIYQSGYSLPPGEPEISIFSAGKDPGIPLKYLGAIVMVAGIITMFYTRRFSSSGKTL